MSSTRSVRSRSALAITLTEDSAIAAAAMTGDSRTPKNGYSTPAAIIGDDLVDAEITPHGLSRRPAIAGQHDDPDPFLPQCGDCERRRRLDRVRDADEAGQAPVD